MKNSLKLNEKFGDIFIEIIKDNEKSTELLKLIDKLYTKNFFREDFILYLIKSSILVLSYKLDNYDIICSTIKEFFYLSKNLIEDFKDIISYINFSQENMISDILVDKIVFNTIDFMKLFHNQDLKLGLNLLYEIILNSFKIKKIDNEIRGKFYLKFIRESIKIIKNPNNNSSSYYLKIIETCGLTTRLINDWFSN
tara:strand:- start:1066 stop:1653 length:588 start_codon:yes stop_codon:yes gene_type:complete